MKASLTGLDRNTASALSYVLFAASGVFFLITEKDKVVRFHALQSIAMFLAYIAIRYILVFTILLRPLASVLDLAFFITWLLAIYKAWLGDGIVVPMIGRYVKKVLKV